MFKKLNLYSISLIRSFSKNVEIPINQLNFNYSRSSGPGGQNVNKVNTKVELRISIDKIDWLTEYYII